MYFTFVLKLEIRSSATNVKKQSNLIVYSNFMSMLHSSITLLPLNKVIFHIDPNLLHAQFYMAPNMVSRFQIKLVNYLNYPH